MQLSSCFIMPISDPFLSQLSPQLFWDVDPDAVDPEAHADFLIVRVMERGTHENVRAAWSYYGASKIQAALLAAPALSPKTIAFFANQFGLRRSAFRAHQRSVQWTA